jgi:outer membrane lipoprotein-sorting protein
VASIVFSGRWRKSSVAVPAVVTLWLTVLPSAPAQMTADTQEDQSAKMILQKADEVRFPSQGFEVSVAIQTSQNGKVSESREYKVLSKGNEDTIVMITAPASERGQIMLMKGRDLWVFLPDVSQPVRLSLAQRLTGQVANGDIARANFSGDYAPKLAGTEKLADQTYYVLDLAAVDRWVTYQHVRLWVGQANYWPRKAEFFSLSGRLLKTCLYDGFKQMAGRMRPTRLVMNDALREGEQSVMDYSDMRLRDLPDKIFSKEYLKKLD